MKYLSSLILLFSFNAKAYHFAELDVLNPIFNLADTSHSLRTDLRFGKDMGNWDVAFRYATELGVTADTDGTGIKGKDGNAHHLGLRGSFLAFPSTDLRVGGGYIYTMFDANVKGGQESKNLNTSTSGFELFISKQWNMDKFYVKSELSYHHIFSNLKQHVSGGYAEYDVGQGKLSILLGREF